MSRLSAGGSTTPFDPHVPLAIIALALLAALVCTILSLIALTPLLLGTLEGKCLGPYDGIEPISGSALEV